MVKSTGDVKIDHECGAYVHTTSDDIYITHNKAQHSHFSDPDEILISQLIAKIRHRVLNEHLPAGFIYDYEVARAQLTQSQLAKMPSFRSIKSALYSARSNTVPTIPKTYEFDILKLYRMNANEEKFLLADHNSSQFDRILIFSSNRQLEIFFNSEVIFCDGTFASSPPHFPQIYTMHAVYEDETIPCVVTLCTHKNTETYNVIIDELKLAAEQMNQQFIPSLIRSDYESGFIEAVKKSGSSVYCRY
ncbi:unnamed protein product [Rotaria sp. Silwood2]|nr:unnamed protein product [Rotaria sp. Silwood2]